MLNPIVTQTDDILEVSAHGITVIRKLLRKVTVLPDPSIRLRKG